jgi:hypothetical protein
VIREDSDGKTEDSRRIVSLDLFTITALRKYVGMLDKERTAFGSSYPDHGKLMVFEDGRPLHPDTITTVFTTRPMITALRMISGGPFCLVAGAEFEPATSGL